ncbi:hypothetical protein L484_008149 [Morus notabilis]|uniref:Uncharacterized protein n=1 Tax=Morus notabilis TaxID=981085 RepID=W9RWI8_9ROSA|nr:hypothetical protein L484_008149 [Morus notabilis]
MNKPLVFWFRLLCVRMPRSIVDVAWTEPMLQTSSMVLIFDLPSMEIDDKVERLRGEKERERERVREQDRKEERESRVTTYR